MKRFLNKTWAKAVTYFLFFVFTVLTAAGGLGIYYLTENDVYLAPYAKRELLYESQVSDVMSDVIAGLYNCSDEEALQTWLLE